MDRLAGRGEPFQHLHVEVGEGTARIHDEDERGQLFAALDVVAQQLLPVQLGRAGHFGIAVARQVDQQGLDLFDDGRVLAVLAHMGAADREVIDVLGAARRLGRESQALLVGKNIDRRGFARVRAPGEGDFGNLRAREIAQLINGREEPGLPKFGHKGRCK